MKFGKELLRAIAASKEVVSADKWINYKGLKKMLKNMPPLSDEKDRTKKVGEGLINNHFII